MLGKGTSDDRAKARAEEGTHGHQERRGADLCGCVVEGLVHEISLLGEKQQGCPTMEHVIGRAEINSCGGRTKDAGKETTNQEGSDVLREGTTQIKEHKESPCWTIYRVSSKDLFSVSV